MVVLAVATGVLTFLNYFWQSSYPSPGLLRTVSVIAQIVLTILTFTAMLRYRGQRSRASYDGGHYRIFTFRFAIIILSLIGNVSVLMVLILYSAGMIASL